jgi:hypothetical protein
VGGATIADAVDHRQGLRGRTTIYAAAGPGIVEHEVAHAYCAQTFGHMGPDWYKEGMADVVMFHVAGHQNNPFLSEKIQLLRRSQSRTIDQVIEGHDITGKLSDSMDRLLGPGSDQTAQVPLSDWVDTNGDLPTAKETYAWSWSLCHMLTYNPNYSERFRALGENFVLNGNDSFALAFQAMQEEMAFEYAFFTQRVDVGYRVDLCSWNWGKPFRELDADGSLTCAVAAARGFQPTGLQVVRGQTYRFRTAGNWRLSSDQPELDANGSAIGGELVGVVFKDFRLSETIRLGVDGTFEAPVSGKLYLRCDDAWNALADNLGQIQVHFTQ